MAEKEGKEGTWKGMHQGSVSGKGFEKSRRSRKTHAERKAQIIHKNQGGK